jgi:EAL domain-containing protein (putative c-di-GMP-specific phosphodiesterase class I)
MDVVANCVETAEQSGKLQAMGCVLGQGYFLANRWTWRQRPSGSVVVGDNSWTTGGERRLR